MADAPAVLSVPTGMPITPQYVGQHKQVYRDVTWTSDGSNETAGKTIEASAVGLQHIFGIDFVGDVGGLHSGSDTVAQLKVVATDIDTWVITGLQADGTALDLDSTDVASARIRILGD